MTNLFEFSRHIGELRKEKKFSEVLTYFRDNKIDFTNEQIAHNAYLVSDMLTALRHTSNFSAGIKFLEIYNIEINEKTNNRILNAYGWLLWSKYKEEEADNGADILDPFHAEDDDDIVEEQTEYSKSDLVHRIEQLMLLLLNLKDDFSQTLISQLFSVVLKTEKRKPSPNWHFVNDFCSHFDPTGLSHKTDTIKVKRKGVERDMELASDFENWYAYKTKALFKLGQWQQCFDLSKEALENIENYHYSNDTWFARRVALSKKNLGNSEDAIAELEQILKRKKEWFIQKELAELYFDKGDLDKAMHLGIEAATNFGPMEYKVDLLYLLGNVLQKKNELTLAYKHYELSKLVREAEEWKVPEKLHLALNALAQHKSDLGLMKLTQELKAFWEGKTNNKKASSVEDKNEKLRTGVVLEILHDNERGKDGFIESDGQRIYFSVSAKFHLTPEVKIGSNIAFKMVANEQSNRDILKIIRFN